MSRLELAINEIKTARSYTRRLLEDLAADDWFRQPTEGVTHIAWQVGHLAMAEYRLALERIRGPRPEDAALISPEFLQKFAKGSVPLASAQDYPAPEEILSVFHRVHEQSLAEAPHVAEAELDRPPEKPHPLFTRKIDSLFWCARHEAIHAGQIGLLRRLLGKPPQW